jgi:hypothetical protein
VDDPGYAEEIVIEPDGRVSIKHLSEPLLRLALALDPHDERLLERALQLPEEGP